MKLLGALLAFTCVIGVLVVAEHSHDAGVGAVALVPEEESKPADQVKADPVEKYDRAEIRSCRSCTLKKHNELYLWMRNHAPLYENVKITYKSGEDSIISMFKEGATKPAAEFWLYGMTVAELNAFMEKHGFHKKEQKAEL